MYKLCYIVYTAAILYFVLQVGRYENDTDFEKLVPYKMEGFEASDDVLAMLRTVLIKESKNRPSARELLRSPVIIKGNRVGNLVNLHRTPGTLFLSQGHFSCLKDTSIKRTSLLISMVFVIE